MKKLIIAFILGAGLMIACSNNTKVDDLLIDDNNHEYKTVIIDNCEYIEYDRGALEYRVYSLTHKGNCQNHPRTNYLK